MFIILLISGDYDYSEVLEKASESGKKIIIVSSEESVSENLVNRYDFLEIADLVEEFSTTLTDVSKCKLKIRLNIGVLNSQNLTAKVINFIKNLSGFSKEIEIDLKT